MYYLNNPYTKRTLLALGIDAVFIIGISGLAWFFLEPQYSAAQHIVLTLTLLIGMIFSLLYNGAYSPRAFGNFERTTVATLCAMGMGLLVGAFVYFFVDMPNDGVRTLAFVAGIFFPVFMIERSLLGVCLTSPRIESRVLILGASDLGLEIARTLQAHPGSGIVPVGFLSDELAYEQQHSAQFEGFPVLGRLHELEKIVESVGIDRIIVASKNRAEQFPEDQLLAAKIRGVRVESGVHYFERLLGRVYTRDLRPSYLIFAGNGFQMSRAGELFKRMIDVVAAGLGLLAASPILAVCGVIIKLESKGPVFFRQERLGLHGKLFKMVKLRSMLQDAETKTGAVFASKNDSRITSFGHFIRKTRLDEVPQLWNILRGEMSLVGPRAEREAFYEVLDEKYAYFGMRSSVKPGLTGWAQTRFGYVNDFEAYEQKISLDLYYLIHRSTLLDLLILVQTFKTVLHFRGM